MTMQQTMSHDGPRAGAPRRTLRVLVVEDDAFTRALVGNALTSLGYEVTAVEAVHRAMAALAESEFNAVVTDLNFGLGPSGADLLARLYEDQPWVGMVALTSHASPELAIGPRASLPPGTVYLVKSDLTDVSVLAGAIDRALAGDCAEQDGAASAFDATRTAVTRSQAEVLRMLSAGMSTAVIARNRATSLRATEMMIQRLYENLGLKHSSDLDPRTSAVLLWQQGRVRVD